MASRTKPNIIVIKTDEQRFDTLGCMGNPVIRTPNIDRLAQEGFVFDNAFCVAPLCVPSRVSFFTGQYVHRTHCTDNATEHHIAPGQWSFVESLVHNGYAAGLAGKNHAFQDAYFEQWFCCREEYDHWGKVAGEITAADAEVRAWRTGQQRTDSSLPDGMLMEGLIDKPEPFPEKQCPPLRIAEDACGFIDAQYGGPFFLHISFPEPHWPNVVCEPYFSMIDPDGIELDGLEVDWKTRPYAHFVQSQSSGFDQYGLRERRRILATYYGQIMAVDTAIGVVLGHLEKRGVRDETIIVFTSDHGDLAGRFGLISKTKAFYEPILRIPLILSLPGMGSGGRIHAQVSNIDVIPTLAEFLGIQAPDRVQGSSFLPVLRGKTDKHREEIFAEIGQPERPPEPIPYEEYPAYNQRRCETDGVFWFIEYTTLGRAAMVRRDGWKYCFYVGDGEELYCLNDDPLELHNLAGTPEAAQIQEKMRRRLMEWLLTEPVRD